MCRLIGENRSFDVGCQQEIDFVAGDLPGHSRLPQAGGVHQHIQAAEFLHRATERRVDRLGIPDIALQPSHRGDVVGGSGAMVCRDHARPRLVQHPHRGGTDTGGAAGDQNAPTRQR